MYVTSGAEEVVGLELALELGVEDGLLGAGLVVALEVALEVVLEVAVALRMRVGVGVCKRGRNTMDGLRWVLGILGGWVGRLVCVASWRGS